MADNWQDYVNDSRTVCKYGSKCYQKNPEHHQTYKHPPILQKKRPNRHTKRFSPFKKNIEQQSPNTSTKIVEQEHQDTQVLIHSESSKTVAEIKRTRNNQNACIDLPEELLFFDKNTDKSILEDLFLVKMPDDFFQFYNFMNNISKSTEETLANVNLELIGPYDFFVGKLPILENKELYLIHWRFFYDPPEFQAVLKKKKSEYHIGYYRDNPEQKTALVASNDSAKSYGISIMSENIFGAVYLYLQNEKTISPFTTIPCQKLMDKIKTYAEQNNISLEKFNMKERLSQIVTKTFHGAGIVVPYNKQTQVGYRRLAETDAYLKKVFVQLEKATSQEEKDKCFSDLQVAVTNASIAVDEGDFGTGLELAIALFCSGLKELQAIALSNFNAAYGVLSRQPFAKIAEVHLKHRRKGSKMSLISKG